MALHPLAGKPAPADVLIDPAALESSFNEAHILAIAQAICDYRCAKAIGGPLYLGMDTHALSAPVQRSTLEVLAANGVECAIQRDAGFTPTPAISRAIVAYNRGRDAGLADGVVVTPSHNPPADGGIKYNAPHGGPADTDATGWIEARANALLERRNAAVRRVPYQAALQAATTRQQDFAAPYIDDLKNVLDMDAIRAAGLKLGVDPRFGFMTLDHDGKIRMDCSSPYAMAGLVGLKDVFRVAWGNDADVDRHGIVMPSAGLMNPNHYLAVAIDYLLAHRPHWPAGAAIGKTLVSSALIDRVVRRRGRRLLEVPVGFKWFASGLHDGSCAFGGEESAGASFVRRDGTAWTTDKDGLIMGLLAAEITARTGKDPSEHYVARLTRAPGNGAPIGGLKVVTENGWFAARPSGTEHIYKLYAESFKGPAHLDAVIAEAQRIVDEVLAR